LGQPLTLLLQEFVLSPLSRDTLVHKQYAEVSHTEPFMTLPLSFLDTATAQQVKALSPEQLYHLKERLTQAIALNKARKRILDDGLQLKYFEAAKIALRSTHRDTGTTRIEDGRYVVTATLPKKVNWDQEKLGAIVEMIPLHERYPAITYVIKEEYYKLWTPIRQTLFMPARTVAIGAPDFKFTEENLA
jgi:hypothetical protein